MKKTVLVWKVLGVLIGLQFLFFLFQIVVGPRLGLSEALDDFNYFLIWALLFSLIIHLGLLLMITVFGMKRGAFFDLSIGPMWVYMVIELIVVGTLCYFMLIVSQFEI